VEHEGSSPYLQDPPTAPCPELDTSSPDLRTLFPKIHSNIIFPPAPKSSECSVPFRLSYQNFVYVSHLSHACYMSCPSRPPWFDHPNNVCWNVQVMNRPIQRSCVTFRNKLFLRRWIVNPLPTPKLEDHPLSAVRGLLFNIIAATLHIRSRSPPSATWGRALPWWQGPT